MIKSGNYVLPFDDVVDVPTKPPMFHWLAVITSITFGKLSEFTVRFPSALCAALGLLLLTVVSSRSLGVNRALLASAILGTSLEWSRSAIHARVDMCFSFGIAVSLVAIYQGMERWRTNKDALYYWVLSSAGATFAFLSKGPAGLVIPIVVTGLFLAISWPQLFKERRVFRLVGIGVTLALGTLLVSGIWYYFAYLQGKDAFVHIHFIRENLGRFRAVEGEEVGHIKPAYYSVLYLIIGFFPWSILFPLVILRLWKDRTKLFERQNKQLLFALIWTTVVVLLITFSQAKRDVYLLPAFPPLAYIFAHVIHQIDGEPRRRGFLNTFFALLVFLSGLALFFALVGIFYLVTAQNPVQILSKYVPTSNLSLAVGILEHWKERLEFFIPGLIAGVAVIAGAKRLWHGNIVAFAWLLSVACVSGGIIGNSLVLSEIAEASSPREFMNEVTQIVKPEARILQYETQFFPAMYYANRRVTRIMSAEETNAFDECFILVRADKVEDLLASIPGSRVVLTSSNRAANGQDRLVLVEKMRG
jgi:4-amino-4-deoxy-L-arabinose transferase-like glycosyltransferase